MPSHLPIAALLLCAQTAAQPDASRASQANDETAVRHTIAQYFKGAETRDARHFQKAFAADAAQMIYVAGPDGEQRVRVVPIAQAIENWTAAPENESWGKIHSIDIIDGKLAVVKLELLWQKHVYIDYMSLYKINGDWKIVSKVFVSRGEAKPAEPS